jgi:hypothetical protein
VRRSTHQQMRDPVTLVVALDEHSSAEGSLFWDDGLSIYGSFMLRRLVFADGALRCQRDSSVESGALQKDGWGLLVERIRVAGLTRPPTSVNIENVPLQFEWTEGGVLVIRRPQVSLDKDWTIQIA